MVQRLRICLPMQGTQVRALGQEDSTFCGASKFVCHNCWSLCSWAREPQLRKPRAQSPGSAARGATAVKPSQCNEEWPLLAATRESPCVAVRTQQPKNKESTVSIGNFRLNGSEKMTYIICVFQIYIVCICAQREWTITGEANEVKCSQLKNLGKGKWPLFVPYFPLQICWEAWNYF